MADRKEKKMKEEEVLKLLDKWQKQFSIDRDANATNDNNINVYEEYYQGKRYFGNLSEIGASSEREVRTVVNFVRMTVEAVIDMSVPEPDFEAKGLDDEDAVMALSKYINYVAHNINDLEKINLENERRVKKFGGAPYKVNWDNSIKNGQYVGDMDITNPHPKSIIPNAGALDWDKGLEHYHEIFNMTINAIQRKWPHITKDDLEDKAVFYKEFSEINDGTGSSKGNTDNSEKNGSESGLSMYSIVLTTYRDEDGDICKIWWSKDLLVDHIPKYYWHRDDNGEPTKTYIVPVGTPIRMGTDPDTKEPIFRTVEQQTDEMGNPLFDEYGDPLGEEAEYYIPKRWDIVYQPYIPQDMCCWGTSMIEDIKDLYESLLKAIYIQEESFLKGNVKIITDNDTDKQNIQDSTSEVIVALGKIDKIDLRTNIDGMAWINLLKEWMQLMTGATNAQMGVHDAGVKSAKQAQLYVSQANFKASLASAYKAIAFKDLYRVMADFALAFCDDDRPFRLMGDKYKNKSEYGTFSRLSMLRDNSGNIVYPNWDVGVSAQAGFMQNKPEILNNIVMLANNKNFEPNRGNLILLKLLSKLGVPMLESIIVDMEIEVEKQEKIAEEQREMQKKQQELQLEQQRGALNKTGGAGMDMNNIISQLPPDKQALFKNLPPEQQQKLLSEVGGGQ